MARNVDILILSAVNTCWATPITMPTLLALIRTAQPPGEWLGPVGQLFAEVSAAAVQRWADQHQLSVAQLAQYFDRFVRPWNVLNPDLEAWFHANVRDAL